MRIIFAGTPEFAAASLDALINSLHDVIAVLTQPDRPSGRGRKLGISAVKKLAQQNQITVIQPLTLKDNDIQALLKSLDADAMVVVAYGLLLPESVLNIPKHGCFNIHASLLPRWRGAAPIQRAIEAGDAQTGISIMQMDAGLDTGDVITMESLPIADSDTSSSLHDKLAELGATLIIDTLNQVESGNFSSKPQQHSHATYAAKLNRDESFIDWQQSAKQIVRKIHAFNPWPNAKSRYYDTELKLHRARIVQVDSKKQPGAVISSHKSIIIQAADLGVEILQLQKPGGRVMTAGEFLNGFDFAADATLV